MPGMKRKGSLLLLASSHALLVHQSAGFVPAQSLLTRPCALTFKFSIRSQSILTQSDEPIVANEEPVDWEARDVYEDLRLLEQAIIAHNAEDDLEHKNRLATRNYICQQKRPLFADLHRFVVRPLFAAFMLVALCKTVSPIRLLTKRVLFRLYALHFWTTIVTAPAIFWFTMRLRQPVRKVDIPPELKYVGNEYVRLDGYQDPRTSTDDSILYLLEQVMSAVSGTALLYPFIAPTLRPTVQLFARLGVLVSWHQYPKLFHDLIRMEQPRPLTLSVHATQLLWKLQGGTWFLVPALAQVMLSWSWTSIALLGMGLGLGYARVRMSPSCISRDNKWIWFIGVNTFAIATVRWLRRGCNTAWLLSILRLVTCRLVVSSLAFAAPVIHLTAFRKGLRVAETSNIALTVDLNEMKQQAENARKNTIWRWRSEWRNPQRIRTVIEDTVAAFLFTWFLVGGFRDPIYFQVDIEKRLDTVLQMGEMDITRNLGVRQDTVLQMGEMDMTRSRGVLVSDPETRKTYIMNKLKEAHERDYNSGNYRDPLGVAVYRVFDIGLGFNFDHMTPLAPGEHVSMRRLHARAAKSAIRRATQIFDSDRINEALVGIEDTAERQKITEQLKRDAKAEITLLGQRLIELLPPFEPGEVSRRKAQMKDSYRYVKVSDHEMLIIENDNVLEALIDDIAPSTNATETSSYFDDEYIEAWKRFNAINEPKKTIDDEPQTYLG